MAKIRGIRPEFWTDETIVEVSPLARLLFVGLWTHACDNGHVQDRPRQIKLRILPADDCDVDELLDELAALGLVTRGDGWVTVPNLLRHQRVDRRYFTCCDAPGCVPPSRTPAESPAGTRRVPHVSTPGARGVEDGQVADPAGTDPAGTDQLEAHPVDDGWTTFWDEYPRKAAKPAARRAFVAASRRAGVDVIMAGLRRHLPAWSATDRQFIPHPATWLNRDGWDDPPPPVGRRRSAADAHREGLVELAQLATGDGRPAIEGGVW